MRPALPPSAAPGGAGRLSPVPVVGPKPTRGRRIAIDVSWVDNQPTGTGVYTQELVRALLRRDERNMYVLYFKDPARYANPLWDLDRPNAEKRVVGPRITNLRNQTLAYHLYRDRIEVFHSPGFFLPYGWLGRKVVTIHDVNHLRCVKHWWRSGMRRKWTSLALQAPLSAHAAARIICPSRFSADDVVRYFHVSARKISVLPQGVRWAGVEPLPQARVADILGRLGLDRYALCVGVLSPQKNLERLIRAFASLGDAPGLPTRLVLTGRDDAGYCERALRPLIGALGLGDRVVLTGYCGDDELRALYAGAACVAQVSEGEGFGLPIVEAMAAGAPVVAANITATAEVAGDAALLVDPTDVEGIASALSRVCVEERLRRGLRERGARRAETFTWDHCAAKTLATYEAVLDGQ